MPNCMKSLDG